MFRFVLAVALVLLGVEAQAQTNPWARVSTPTAGPAQVIGSYANGCIAGAVPLPLQGPGYQAIRMSRSRFYGHPQLIDFIQDWGRSVAAAGIGTALIGDLGQPRGGPMPYGHASHQIGLDADIWFRLDIPPLPLAQREDIDEVSMVAAGGRTMSTAWSRAHAEMVRLAAIDIRVERIFVNPAIKLALCSMDWPDRAWLNVVRPWYGHAAHFHVRLRCPVDSPNCEPQDLPPPGEGCGDELMSWFRKRPPSPPTTPVIPKPRPPLPAQCMALLSAP